MSASLLFCTLEQKIIRWSKDVEMNALLSAFSSSPSMDWWHTRVGRRRQLNLTLVSLAFVLELCKRVLLIDPFSNRAANMSTRILRLARVLSAVCVFTSICPLTPSLSTVVLLQCLSAVSSVLSYGLHGNGKLQYCHPDQSHRRLWSPLRQTDADVAVTSQGASSFPGNSLEEAMTVTSFHFLVSFAVSVSVSVWRPSNCLVGTCASNLAAEVCSIKASLSFLFSLSNDSIATITLHFTLHSLRASLATYKWQLKSFQFTALCSFRFFLSFTNSKRLHYLLDIVSVSVCLVEAIFSLPFTLNLK